MSDQIDYIVGYIDNQGNKHTVSVTATDVFSAFVAVKDAIGTQRNITVFTSCLPTQQDDHTPTTDS